jgi:hypothetical protein
MEGQCGIVATDHRSGRRVLTNVVRRSVRYAINSRWKNRGEGIQGKCMM